MVVGDGSRRAGAVPRGVRERRKRKRKGVSSGKGSEGR